MVVPLVAWCVQHTKNVFSFLLLFLNLTNFNLQNHSKIVLEWSGYSFMVRNAKNSYWSSLCLPEFCKRLPWSPKIILKWFYRLKLVGLKKKSRKKDPFWGNLCGKVSSCIDNVYVLHITPPGAPPSTAVDNGGDRSCQFLGLRPYIQILCLAHSCIAFKNPHDVLRFTFTMLLFYRYM